MSSQDPFYAFFYSTLWLSGKAATESHNSFDLGLGQSGHTRVNMEMDGKNYVGFSEPNAPNHRISGDGSSSTNRSSSGSLAHASLPFKA